MSAEEELGGRFLFATSMELRAEDRLREATTPISSDDGPTLISEYFSDVVSVCYFQISLMGRACLEKLLELDGQAALNNISTSGISPVELRRI